MRMIQVIWQHEALVGSLSTHCWVAHPEPRRWEYSLHWCLWWDGNRSRVGWDATSPFIHLDSDAEDPLPLPWGAEESLLIGCHRCVMATSREQRWKRECAFTHGSVRLHMARVFISQLAPSSTPNTTWCHVLLRTQLRRSLTLTEFLFSLIYFICARLELDL